MRQGRQIVDLARVPAAQHDGPEADHSGPDRSVVAYPPRQLKDLEPDKEEGDAVKGGANIKLDYKE
jgi:hypothetical protein